MRVSSANLQQKAESRHMPNPAVSIIITCGPTYEKWLPHAVSSALKQRDADVPVEVIVVRDGVESPADNHPDVRYMAINASDVMTARQTGLAAANGDAVLFLDADDTLSDNFVVNAYSQLRAATRSNPFIAGIYPAVEYIEAETGAVTGVRAPADWSKEVFECENFIVISTLTWTHALRTVWGWLTPTDNKGIIEDYFMWAALVRAGWVFHPGRNITLRVYTHADSLSMTNVDHRYHVRYAIERQPITALFLPRVDIPESLLLKFKDWLLDLPDNVRLIAAIPHNHDQYASQRMPMRATLQEVCGSRTDARLIVYRYAKVWVEHQRVTLENELVRSIHTPFTLLVNSQAIPTMSPTQLISDLAAQFQNDVGMVSATRRGTQSSISLLRTFMLQYTPFAIDASTAVESMIQPPAFRAVDFNIAMEVR